MSDTILTEVQEGLAIVKLNRPTTYNAMNSEMAQLLIATLEELDRRVEVRAILLTGEGKAFCSGQDLSDVEDISNVPFSEIIDRQYNPLVHIISTLSKPILCYVNGVAAGAGANLALLCDILVASESAVFIQAFSKIGLIPDTAGTYFLPRIVGYQNALALMMTGDKIDAADAHRLGMVYRVFSDETAYQEAVSFGQRLANMPTVALAKTKELVRESYHNTLEKQLDLEKQAQEEMGKTQDFKEGVESFLEKRKPNFIGR